MAQEPDKITGALSSDEDAHAQSPSATTTEIRSQIEETREAMSQTLDEIQARLSPGRLVADAKQTVQDATVRRVKRLVQRTDNAFGAERVLSAIKASPLPVALAGVTAAALILRGRSPSRHRAENTRRLLVAACAGLACWSAWRARQSRGLSSVWPIDDSLAAEIDPTNIHA